LYFVLFVVISSLSAVFSYICQSKHQLADAAHDLCCSVFRDLVCEWKIIMCNQVEQAHGSETNREDNFQSQMALMHPQPLNLGLHLPTR